MIKFGVWLLILSACLCLGEAGAAMLTHTSARMMTLREVLGTAAELIMFATGIPPWLLDQKAFAIGLTAGTGLFLLGYCLKPARG